MQNDALDMTKIESGNLVLETVPFSIRDVVQTIDRVESKQANTKGITLTHFVDDKVPHVLLGDPTRIRQILINFIGNAIKFTSKGGVHLTVRLLTLPQAQTQGLSVNTGPAGGEATLDPLLGGQAFLDDRDKSVFAFSPERSDPVSLSVQATEWNANQTVAVEISVRDTGTGIDESFLPKLFQPYSQAKLSIMRSHGGTGLGLAIVSRMVK
jgi:signal transduction histidine kinase